MFRVNTVSGGSFFLPTSLVNEPCCSTVPTSLSETFLLFQLCRSVRMLSLMERHKVCAASFKFVACRSAEPCASGHEGLILQRALSFQGELPVKNIWCWWEPLVSHLGRHTCRTYMGMYTRIAGSGPLSSLGVGDGTGNLKHDLTAMKMVA